MVDSTYPNRYLEADMARQAHQAKQVIPPMPALDYGKMPPECKTPVDRLTWVRQARRDWESTHLAHGFRR